MLSFTFSAPLISPIGPATLVAAGDFNNDGRTDLLVRTTTAITPNAAGAVRLFLGSGDGRFSNAGFFVPAGANVTSMAVADFNQDGNLDAAFTNDLASGRVTIALGNGDGTFFSSTNSNVISSYFAGARPSGVAVADFNGDDIPDLLVSNAEMWTSPSSALPVIMHGAGLLIGNGDGSFQPVRQIPTGGATTDVAVGDVNDDGIRDAVLSGFIFTATSIPPVPYVDVLIGRPNGGFDTSGFVPFNTGTIAGAVLADLNGNDRDDLALLAAPSANVPAANVTGSTVRTFFAGNDGTFTAGPTAATFVTRPAGLNAADFDRDGSVDLAVAGGTPSTTPNATGSAVSVLRGLGGGSFAQARLFRTHGIPLAQLTADLNGDGRTDVLTSGSTGVSVLINRPVLSPLSELPARETARDFVRILD